MTESQYNFSDFTIEHYKLMLMEAKAKNYGFYFYDEISDKSEFILWRHDVDFSVNRALRLARVENEMNVKSTYFIHLHSEYYNAFEKDISKKILEIISLGHQIGLHFDTHYYNITDENELEAKLLIETDLIYKFFGVKAHVFSFHNTSPFTMACQKYTYGGMVNTYAAFFQNEVEYCSDSNGYWRYKRMIEVIRNNTSKKLQILTHPEWWQEEIMSPWQKIKRAIDGRAANNKKNYQEQIRNLNLKNIDWDGEIP
ncbi:MAG: hypothetical protein WDM90_21180 [Ferruginibacter sp.]